MKGNSINTAKYFSFLIYGKTYQCFTKLTGLGNLVDLCPHLFSHVATYWLHNHSNELLAYFELKK